MNGRPGDDGQADPVDPTRTHHLRRVVLSVSGGAFLTVATFVVADSASANETVQQVGPDTAAADAVEAPPTSPVTPGQPTELESSVLSEGEAEVRTGENVAVGTSADATGTAATGDQPTGSGDGGQEPNGAVDLADLVLDASGPDQHEVPDAGTDAPGVVLSSEVVNIGIAIADTGGNTALGNASDNDADATGDGPDSTGTAANDSDGSAEIATGPATAVGNVSDVEVAQQWFGILSVDGVLYLVERSSVVNAGLGIATTGGNSATGNASTNAAAAGADGGPGSAANTSEGTAIVSTGAATAVGNDSVTTVVQYIGVTEDGSVPVVIEQLSYIVNVSVSVATTGGNTAIGNASTSTAAVDAAMRLAIDRAVHDLIAGAAGLSGAPEITSGDTRAVSAINQSGGYATITTGSASAVGNQSVTTIRQGWTGAVVGEGVIYIVQQSVVVNIGVAFAGTGGNVAIGNASTNTATVGAGTATSATEVVAGTATNTSNGIAIITTGTATALGSTSVTTVTQVVSLTSTSGTPVPYLLVQRSVVYALTLDLASTGENSATGNQSVSTASTGIEGSLGRVLLPSVSGSATSGSAANVSATNVSGGYASIVTGAAVAGVVLDAEPEDPDDPVPSDPAPAPAPEPAPAPTPEPAVVVEIAPDRAESVEPAGTLPYTGADLGPELAAGALLTLLGAAMERRSRVVRRLRRTTR